MVNCPKCGEENPAKFRLCGYCGAPLTGVTAAPLPAHEIRKTVTLVFCDLKGSTALGEQLDPEALHEVKDRYFSAMAAEITRHGGKIEKYIGDAIMAVFGLPRAHEDDALRAVRAAAGMQAALGRVNQDLLARYGVALSNRTGVNTGEVVANDDPGADQKLVTGDAVNVAARLEQAAPENQIYLGEITYRLVRDAVDVDRVEPLELKGKAGRVAAYRLLLVRGLDGNSRRHDTPVIGRDEELAALDQAYREVVEGQTVRLVTLVGDAGVGKSRLAHEVTERVAAGARVLRGRCLPYGDGITFWPLVEMVREAACIRPEDTPETAQAKLLATVGDGEVAARLASATGLSTTPFPLHELYWGARKFLQILALNAPVVALIDDIHWAEPAFLDLLEHILAAPANAPLLLLATARHELLEQRANWGEQPGAMRLVLRPLTAAATALVVANLLGSADLPDDVAQRIVGAAEGNPFFVEQMLSMLIDNGALRIENGRWVQADKSTQIAVPPTIQALLEARLDQLQREERAAVEPAAVIGLEFPRPAVEALATEALRPAVGTHLTALTRKRFIQPGEDVRAEVVYRFHHQLVRETVYGGLLKRVRATLHIDFVRWADKVNAERGRDLEFQEILGYHLEQAHRYLTELGPLDDAGVGIGVDAARRLAGAGRRAFARGDMHAAANLVQRATALLSADHPDRLALLPELGEALMQSGQFAAAKSILSEAEAAAQRTSNDRLKASAQLAGMFVRLYGGESGDWSAEALRVANEAIPMLERAAAHDELATAWRLIGFVHGVAGRYGRASEANVRYMAHARQAGNERLVARSERGVAIGALLGPTPVPEAIELCDRMLAKGNNDRQVRSVILCVTAQLRAMNGEFEQARSLYRSARALIRDLGASVSACATGIYVARVELLAGDVDTAEQELRSDYEFLSKMGESYLRSTLAAVLSRIVGDRGDDVEALALSKIAEETAADDDVETQALWRVGRAAVIARSGNLCGAEELARAAVEYACRAEAPLLQADTQRELAAVLKSAGRTDEARAAIELAIRLYIAKGDRVSAARATAWAESVDRSSPVET